MAGDAVKAQLSVEYSTPENAIEKGKDAPGGAGGAYGGSSALVSGVCDEEEDGALVLDSEAREPNVAEAVAAWLDRYVGVPLFVREKVGVLLADAPNVSEAVLVAVSEAVLVANAVRVPELDTGDQDAVVDWLVDVEPLTVALASTDADEDAVPNMLADLLVLALALEVEEGDTVTVADTDCVGDTEGDTDADAEGDDVTLVLALALLVLLMLRVVEADCDDVRDCVDCTLADVDNEVEGDTLAVSETEVVQL